MMSRYCVLALNTLIKFSPKMFIHLTIIVGCADALRLENRIYDSKILAFRHACTEVDFLFYC